MKTTSNLITLVLFGSSPKEALQLQDNCNELPGSHLHELAIPQVVDAFDGFSVSKFYFRQEAQSFNQHLQRLVVLHVCAFSFE